MGNYLTQIQKIKVATGLKNLMTSFRINYKQEIRDGQKEIQLLDYKIRLLRNELLYFKILDFFSRYPNLKYASELAYLNEVGSIALFPYRQHRRLEPVTCEIDSTNKMPFVLHQGHKRLYFPASYTVDEARDLYISLVEQENILGGGYIEKAPHQYLTETFGVCPSDTVLDIGTAEGLFALDVVDKVRKVYAFECDPSWEESLKATFAPYKDKVVIINKYVSDVDSATEIRLDTCLKNETYTGLFLKLDIESNEKAVLTGSKDLLTQPVEIRIACCTYHRQNDASYIKELLESFGYQTEFSDGYMIYVHDDAIQPPYFRHGLIRASKPVQVA